MSDEQEIDISNLKQYLDSDHPLLNKFKSAAPGTFRHSMNIADLSESVVSDLGLDATLMRVCAYYHDIGKMMNPKYFTENQNGEGNPHDNLEPHISYQLITRHVSDSLLILINETDMPKNVLEIISEHHGDCLLKSIFKKIYHYLTERSIHTKTFF